MNRLTVVWYTRSVVAGRNRPFLTAAQGGIFVPFDTRRNGTLTEWTAPDGTELIFKEQMMDVGEQKLRGGAYVCCPIFGDTPDLPEYQGVALKKHGLVRLGNAHLEMKEARRDSRHYYEFLYADPWPHQVTIAIEETRSNALVHTLKVEHFGETGKETAMPLSIGFHPYFATHGEPFQIRTIDTTIRSEDIVPGNVVRVSQKLAGIQLQTSKGEIIIDTQGYAAGFAIWTDAPRHYICIEPVAGIPVPLRLRRNETIEAYTIIRFCPFPVRN